MPPPPPAWASQGRPGAQRKLEETFPGRTRWGEAYPEAHSVVRRETGSGDGAGVPVAKPAG